MDTHGKALRNLTGMAGIPDNGGCLRFLGDHFAGSSDARAMAKMQQQ